MKPNFALDLSHEGINLLHRGKGGWTLVGSVALDDPDMGARLDDLRRSAAMLESGGFTTKLVIPNSQILYTTVDAAGPDDISREVQIRAALDGVTPYAVGDLVFDWRAEGDRARVAVLARETMDEAESFASEYKLNPVSFVARPDRGDFSGEPFFGKTRAATRLLPPNVRVEPDASPVPRNPRALELEAGSRIDLPEDEAPDAPVAAPESEEVQPQPDDAAHSDTPDRDEPALAPDLPEADSPEPPETTPDDKAERPPKPKRKRQSPQQEGGRVLPPALAPFPPTPDELDDTPMPRPRSFAPSAKPSRSSSPSGSKSAESTQAEEKPQRAPAPATDAKPASPPIATDSTEDASGSDSAAPAAFHSRRAPADAPADSPNQPDNRLSAMPPRIGIGAPPSPKAGQAETSEPPASKPPSTANTATSNPDAKPAPPPISLPPANQIRTGMADALSRPLPSPDKPVEKPAPGGRLASGLARTAKDLTARVGDGLKKTAQATKDRAEARRARKSAQAEAKRAAETPAPGNVAEEPEQPPGKPGKLAGLFGGRKAKIRSEAEAQRAREAEALTVFGARKSQDMRGRPKYLGLILTLLLLLAMAVIAVWSSYVVSDGETTLFNTDPDEIAAVEPASPEAAPPAEPDQPVPDATVPQPPLDSPAVLSPEAAEARYAATGIWQRAPEPLVGPDTTRLSTRDLVSLTPAMPERQEPPTPEDLPGQLRDALMTAPVPPPPPGTSFDLDENGLVRPTPEGALSPTGILVFAGQPARVPPPRPTDLPDVAPPFALPDVPNLRPRPRPADLVPPAPEATVEDPAPEAEPPAPEADEPPATDDNAALSPTDDEAEADEIDIADLRPEPRPDDLVVSTAAASDAIDAAVTDAIAADLVNATELAVASSRKPSHRPTDFATIVDSAREAASDGSRVATAPAATRAVASASVTPAIPTSASVATQATLKNAINLRDINLIGIYGTSSARRALVRLKNGRYVKVEVGDTLEGGRVTSITASELTYQKGSRAYKLEVLPLG